MADLKRHMTRHLRSAQEWLTRAEDSFDKDSNIRGELNLFLAQAELQHARETNSSRQWRYKYPVLRHAVSLVLATTIVAVGFGAYLWSSERSAGVPVPLAIQETKTMPVVTASPEMVASKNQVEAPPAILPMVSVAPSQAVAPSVERTAKNERSRQPEKDNLLPPDELQKIIRAAGKSLRGQ